MSIFGLKMSVNSASRSEYSAGRCLVSAMSYDDNADITLLLTVWSTDKHHGHHQ